MNKRLVFIAFTSIVLTAAAQNRQGVVLSGSIQSDMLVPENDEEIGAEKSGDLLNNTYVELLLQSRHVDAGAQLEYLEHPLPGFDKEYEGWGVPNVWVKGRLGGQELTLGTFYEQFGSGFILRTYEERSLGIDNSLLGAHLVLCPAKGVTLKALSGKQRCYWSWNGGLVTGADGEVSLDEWMPTLQQHDTRLTLGASWVNKYENDRTDGVRYDLPRYVNAWDVRMNLNHGPLSLLAEYAQKTRDPSADNGYSNKKGSAAMLSGSYSKKGFSVLLQAKRSENMSFRSKHSLTGNAGYINHLPPFALDHTYTLAALYAYATQLASGEWAWQGEVGYNFKRKTAVGGRYGMNVKLNLSYVRAVDEAWLKWGGQTYYQDLNVQLSRRLTRNLKLNLMYMNQHYNMTVVEGDGGMVRSNIFVADAMYHLSSTAYLRGEVQYLTTRQDERDWAFGLLELSLAPHWMFTVSDQWNCGDSKTHYYQGVVTFNLGAHHIQASYGRTQAGLSCTGGVCRYIPAIKGLALSYNCNF